MIQDSTTLNHGNMGHYTLPRIAMADKFLFNCNKLLILQFENENNIIILYPIKDAGFCSNRF